MSLDSLVGVLPIIGIVIGATLGALFIHYVRERRPRWWPGGRKH
ncbi:MAG: hypothetical protein AB7O28_02575 [Vicinamibacterales bacterium]